MFVQARQSAILEQLRRRPRVSVTELQRRLGASRSTLRRDLMALEQQGEILRVHGGVVLRGYLRGEPTFERRRGERVRAKQAIARTAARLVGDNVTVYVDAGTTCLQLGRELLSREDVRIVTNSVALLAEAGSAAATVVCVGGELRGVSQALIAGLTLTWLKGLHFDIAFLGASGLSQAGGVSTTDLTEAQVKQQVIDAAGRAVLLCDAEKWDRPAAVRFADWQAFDSWISDRKPGGASLKSLNRAGIPITLAKDHPS